MSRGAPGRMGRPHTSMIDIYFNNLYFMSYHNSQP